MTRLRCEMSSPRICRLLFTAYCFIGICYGGPLPDANITSSEIGTTMAPGSCARGLQVYRSGESFPGSDPCERCSCASGEISCARETCAPRPGCKAVHRPDHCCPTYQCECEQEGRVYGNGEKLVDPQDPCRVCYCQGGEVVCRRIACFLRDDCRPRLVPGRCCPEYDNCPLRGVTAIPGGAPSVSPAIEDVGTTPAPSPPPEKVKQEITIKEITPVSEIPVITEVKIKEILPSPSIEVIEYPSSSKSPLIPREATTEKSTAIETEMQTVVPVVVDSKASSPSTPAVSSTAPDTGIKSNNGITEMRPIEDLYPSKISLSTQDAINSEIYPSNVPGVTSITYSSASPPPSTTKAPVIEEEETPVFEHNPAFPPLPDDLSVLSNHEDENSPEPSVSMDTDHNEHVIVHDVTSSVASITETTTTIKAAPKILTTTTTTTTPVTTTVTSSTEAPITKSEEPTSRSEPVTNHEAKTTKASPMLNLRSAIPTEILSVPSSVSEVITGELDEIEEPSTTNFKELTAMETSTASKLPIKEVTVSSQTIKPLLQDSTQEKTASDVFDTTTSKLITETTSTSNQEEFTTSFIPKSNIATEITSHTELSSLPIETSDQNPPATSINDNKDKITSTEESLTVAPTSIKIIPTEAEPITVSRDLGTDKQFSDNVETTEFVISTYGSSESTTNAVELIKISNEPNAKNAAIIEPSSGRKNSVLTDLKNLVGDVASISDHTDAPTTIKEAHIAGPTGIPDSEELIPVNAGYKSKINNFNLNSITEVPFKSKTPTSSHKTKGMEIEDDDEAESITDLPSPSKAEPTTRRPIIDNVNDVAVQNNQTAQRDIEIITKSYVPTINRRPTKVIMKKNSDRTVNAMTSTEAPLVSTPGETTAGESVSTTGDVSTSAPTSTETFTQTSTETNANTEQVFSTPSQ